MDDSAVGPAQGLVLRPLPGTRRLGLRPALVLALRTGCRSGRIPPKQNGEGLGLPRQRQVNAPRGGIGFVEVVMSGKRDIVYKRCGCADEQTGRQRAGRCARLAEPGHGS